MRTVQNLIRQPWVGSLFAVLVALFFIMILGAKIYSTTAYECVVAATQGVTAPGPKREYQHPSPLDIGLLQDALHE